MAMAYLKTTIIPELRKLHDAHLKALAKRAGIFNGRGQPSPTTMFLDNAFAHMADPKRAAELAAEMHELGQGERQKYEAAIRRRKGGDMTAIEIKLPSVE